MSDSLVDDELCRDGWQFISDGVHDACYSLEFDAATSGIAIDLLIRPTGSEAGWRRTSEFATQNFVASIMSCYLHQKMSDDTRLFMTIHLRAELLKLASCRRLGELKV